jgi:GxxExxY protein
METTRKSAMEVTTLPFMDRELNHRILGLAIKVHRSLGPGLLESVYRTCLVHELRKAGMNVRSEVQVPVVYADVSLDCGYRADVIVQDSVLLELKAVDKLLAIHEAQLLTYLKLSRLRVGFLINFNVASLRNGIRRLLR